MRYLIAFSVLLLVVVGMICYLSFPAKHQLTPPPDKIDNAVHSVIFHGVSTDPASNGFSISPDYLRDVFRMIQIGEKKTVFASEVANFVIQREIPEPNLVSLTFDDGDKGLIEYVDPLLKEFGFKATAFVFTGGTEEGKRHHSWSDLQKLEATGRWEIHSHSHAHKRLLDLKKWEIDEDLRNSLGLLQEHNLCQFPVLAYPFGEFDARIASVAKDAGFNAAFTAGPNPKAVWDSDIFAIPRTTIAQSMGQEVILNKLGLEKDRVIDQIEIIDLIEIQPSKHKKWQGPQQPSIEVNNTIVRKSDLTHGQYGEGYLKPGTQPEQFHFDILEPGEYEISIWVPNLAEPHDVKLELMASSPSGRHKSAIDIQYPRTNGWNLAATYTMYPDLYTIHLIKIGPNTPFDAIKIERVDSI